MERKKYSWKIGLGILVLFHLVGVIGLSQGYTQNLFLLLTPFNLILSTFVLAYYHEEWSMPFVIASVSTFVMGWGVEVLGVQTGVIFGVYSYGEGLGWGLFGVPLSMGLNWMLLVYTTAIMARKVPVPTFLQAVIASALMVMLDVVIEPVAISLDFWSWETELIPVQNYIAWFVIAWLMVMGVNQVKTPIHNPLAEAYYLIQLGFFGMFHLLFSTI
ncbi:MAG: carotenoid biosynthesis protein [Bacteroidota bacterium]